MKLLKPLWSLIRDIAMAAFVITIIFLVFSAMMMPQVGFAYFIKYGGGPMIPPLIAVFLLGRTVNRGHPDRISLAVVALLILAMVNMRGFYWDIFGRGRGFFTANRISANGLYVITFFLMQIRNFAASLWNTLRSRDKAERR